MCIRDRRSPETTIVLKKAESYFEKSKLNALKTASAMANIANVFALCAVDGLPKSFKAKIKSTDETSSIISIIFLKHF